MLGGIVKFLAAWRAEPALCGLLRNSRKTECGAIHPWLGWRLRAAPFAPLRNSPAQRSLTRRKLSEFLTVRRAELALCARIRNSRKTESGAIRSWPGLEVRAAPFALLPCAGA